jgi:tetratricopeptide (TPR) repeat protein
MKENKNVLQKRLFVLFSFIILAFAIYMSSINSSFHFDDSINITDNPDVMITELSLSALKRAALTTAAGIRPVSYLSFAVNYYVSGMDTVSYHVINIIIHIINAFLIYLIILTLFDYGAADDEKKNRLAVSAFFTALFWLVTPLNSQTVIYIVQRMTLLMTMFFLLAFYAYLLSKKKKRALFLALSGIFFALSILSKQNGVTFPLVIILYELVFVKKGNIKSITKKEGIFLATIFLVLLVTLLIYKDAILNSIVQGYRLKTYNMSERLFTQCRMLVFYLSLLVLPMPSRLSLTHAVLKSTSILYPITTLFSLAFLTALFIFSIVRIKRSPYLSFAILWFFITISVESSILPLEMAYEHRIYMPGIFLIGAVVNFIVCRFCEKNKMTTLVIFCAAAIFLSALTDVRGMAWRNDLTLWSDVVEKYPNSSWGYNNLGIAQSKLGDMDGAEQSFLKTVEFEKNPLFFYKSLGNLGNVYLIKKDYKNAIKWFNAALKHNPSHVPSYTGIAEAYSGLKDYNNSLAYFNKALDINPKDSFAYNGIGTVYKDMGNYKEALIYFKKALYYNPDNIQAQKGLEETEKLLD